MTTHDLPTRLATLALLAAPWLPLAGCAGKASDPPPEVSTSSTSQASDHFSMAIDYLERFDEFDAESANQRIHDHLSQWILEQPPNREWTPEPLIMQLPDRYKPKLAVSNIGDRYFLRGFFHDDIYFLREAIKMREISNWVAAGELHDEQLAAWFEKIEAEHGADYAAQLTGAWLLFDWTVRNVQLDPAPTIDDVLVPPDLTLEDEDPDNPGSAELRARRVAGAKYGAWEAVQLGHGDALTRAHIFALLVRQWSDMEVVLVAGERIEGLPDVWAAGLMLGEDLYLFDPELGLPIPGPGDVGIATLAQVVESPELLRQLDLPGEPYPVTAEDLGPIYLLVMAGPGYFSQRMELVERSLPAAQRLQLSVSPSQLAPRLRKQPGVADVLLWIGPYEQYLYMDRLANAREVAVARLLEYEPFNGHTSLAQARSLHMAGEFDSTLERMGAKEMYLACRLPDSQIVDVDVRMAAEQILRESGEMPVDPTERAAMIQQTMQFVEHQQQLLQRSKRDASYWLGLANYDDDEFETAAAFFRDRVLGASTPSVWEPGARYNLARCYEILAAERIDPSLLEQAIELYEADDSPQRHGNLLRARRLAGEDAAEVEAEEAGPAEEEAVESESAAAEPVEAEPAETEAADSESIEPAPAE